MRTLIALAATVLALALAAPAPASGTAESGKTSERSVYQLDAPWTDDSGKSLRLSDLGGGVQVLTLIFTSCTGACPTTVKALHMFARQGNSSADDETTFVLVTVDPERDTLDVLRRYRREMHLEKDGWKLLRGPDSEVRKLAAVLGFNYEQIDSGQFVHSSLITVLNARGEIVYQQNGVGADTVALKDAIHRAAIEDSQ